MLFASGCIRKIGDVLRVPARAQQPADEQEATIVTIITYTVISCVLTMLTRIQASTYGYFYVALI